MSNKEFLLSKLRKAILATEGYMRGPEQLDKSAMMLKAANSLVQAKFLKACKAKRHRDAELLLSSNPIDLDAAGNDHKTALYHAISTHSLPLVLLLLKHRVDVSRKSFVFFRVDCTAANFESCDEPPIVTAARDGTSEILECLLDYGANPNDVAEIPYSHQGGAGRGRGRSALHFACDKANVDMVRLLISHGADANAEDSRAERPLHVVSRCRATTCVAQREIVELLCEAGADIEALNRKDCTPLFLAALYGCTLKVEALIKLGAGVNTGDGGYGSALHVAAYKDRLPLAALLVCSGARLDRKNAAGYTPLALNIASQAKSEIASLLVYHGSRMDTLDPKRDNMTLLAACISGMRLDCESLAVLMVQAGYDLNRDLWLVPEHLRDDYADTVVPDVQIAAGRVRRLCDWLRRVQTNSRSLAELCRVSIRRRLCECTEGTSIVASVGALPLPAALRNFLLLKDWTGSTMESTIMDYLLSVKEVAETSHTLYGYANQPTD